MRVLVVTKVFPNAAELAVAPFNRHQFGELARLCEVEVLALVPWFPGRGMLSDGAAARRRRGVPKRERIDGMRVLHPRVLYAPGPGRALSGALYAASLLPHALARRGRVDVVLGSFAYPDGWAAVAVARLLGVPAVVKVHGSDINIYRDDPALRGPLRWALSSADAVVGPSAELCARAVELGAGPERTHFIANGVDEKRFRPLDPAACRRALGYEGDSRRWILFVGRLEPEKGLFELLRAFEEVRRRHPDAALVLVGDGVCREEVRARARHLPIVAPGARLPEEVPLWLGAADLFTLPSWAEGTPNVVLEALASGRPVVASAVGGVPAVLRDPALGELVPPRDAGALARALGRVLDQRRAAEEIVARAPLRSWAESGRELHGVLAEAAALERRAAAE